eukprot:gene4726-6631_t
MITINLVDDEDDFIAYPSKRKANVSQTGVINLTEQDEVTNAQEFGLLPRYIRKSVLRMSNSQYSQPKIVEIVVNYCKSHPNDQDVNSIVANCTPLLVTKNNKNKKPSPTTNQVNLDDDFDFSAWDHLIFDPVKEVLSIFPSASIKFVQNLLTANLNNVELVVSIMVEKGYDKEEESKTSLAPSSSSIRTTLDFASSTWSTSPLYISNATNELQNNFPYIRQNSIVKLFNTHNKHYFHTLIDLEKITGIGIPYNAIGVPHLKLKKLSSQEINEVSLTIKKNKSDLLVKCSSCRVVSVPNYPLDPLFNQELDWIVEKRKLIAQQLDHEYAEGLNEKIAEDEGGMIECGCCCCDYPFEKMISCDEGGHLFCKTCVLKYVEQTVFGDNKSVVKCLNTAEKCDGTFTDFMLRCALPPKTYEKFQEAIMRDAIKAAGLNLVSCYHCQMQVEMTNSAGNILYCPSCRKETCRLCKEPSHVPLKCSEVEKKSATSLRLSVEESMTQARKDISKEQYKHFCQTPHCNHKSCSKCKLFTDSVEDDRQAMLDAGLKVLKSNSSTDPEAGGNKIEIEKLLEGGMKPKAGGLQPAQFHPGVVPIPPLMQWNPHFLPGFPPVPNIPLMPMPFNQFMPPLPQIQIPQVAPNYVQPPQLPPPIIAAMERRVTRKRRRIG